MNDKERLLSVYGEQAINLACKRYRRGAKMKDVAAALGVRREKAYRFVHAFGWTRRPGAKPAKFKMKIKAADKTALRKMMEEGRPVEDMAADLGRSVFAIQKIMQDIPVLYRGKHKFWLPAEEKQLRNLVQMGKSSREIARILRRTMGSVNARRYQVLKLKSGRYRRWTPAQERKALALFHQGMSYEQIAFRLDRSVKATTERLFILRRRERDRLACVGQHPYITLGE